MARKGIPQFGLVAEDVAKVDPNLVARDEHRVYSLVADGVGLPIVSTTE